MKIKDVLILKDAINDLEDGKQFYDKNKYGVGDYFWDSIISDIESLIIYAGIHNKNYGFYRMLARRFPYFIYYEFLNEIAYVAAILPMRRDPSWIKKKLSVVKS